MMTTWKELLVHEMRNRGETPNDIVSNTMSEDEMNEEFDSGFGGVEGIPFTVWTKNTVYIPGCYDGAEFVISASRNPDGKPTEHQGG
jgi:hypothetical protein